MNYETKRKIVDATLKHVAEIGALTGSGLEKARQEFEDVWTWSPDSIDALPEEVMTAHKESGAPGSVPPLFCESTLYELLGKCDARTLLAFMGSLGKSLGFSEMDLHNMHEE